MRSLDFLQATRSGWRRWRQVAHGVAAAALFVLAAPSSYAVDATASPEASEGAVRVKLTQVRVQIEAGQEKLVEVETVKPGDVIEYRAVYTNTTKQTVRDLVASLPMPQGLAYVAKSAKASAGLPPVQAATRDGKFGAEPLMVTEGGKKVAVPYAQYRELRWRVGAVEAGRSVTVSARAQVPALAEAPPVAPEVTPPR